MQVTWLRSWTAAAMSNRPIYERDSRVPKAQFLQLDKSSRDWDLGQLISACVSDNRLTDSAQRLYTFIILQAGQPNISRSFVSDATEFGRDKMQKAIACLEEHGYMDSSQHRLTSGKFEAARHQLLNPLAGRDSQPRTIIVHGDTASVVDQQKHPSRQTPNGNSTPPDDFLKEGFSSADNGRVEVDVTMAGNPVPAEPIPAVSLPDRQVPDVPITAALVPAGTVPDKVLKDIKVKNNQSSSVLEVNSRHPAEIDDRRVVPPDDALKIEMSLGVSEAALDQLLSRVHSKLRIAELAREIPWSLLSRLDIVRACSEILGRSKGPVNDQNAFVAKAINANPEEFVTNTVQAHSPRDSTEPGAVWTCSRNGHKTDFDNPWRTCFVCDQRVLSAEWKCDQHGHFRHQVSEKTCRGCRQNMIIDLLLTHEPGDF